jgi:Flp pilus assembly protein TadD
VLSDDLAIFIRGDAARERRGAVSHVESMALSRCRRESGMALSCITCHDPHVQPDAGEKAGYYRARCLGCHAAKAEGHHARQPDCTSCHMPRMESADISHTVVTDHRIVREPQADRPRAAAAGALVQFGSTQPEPRDLGLAYGEVALRGDAFAAGEALRLLQIARQRYPDDADVLTRLGHLHQMLGETDTAEAEYQQALERDPERGVVAANLGVFYARRGLLNRSLELWRPAFDKNPQLSELGVNLGRGLCATGDTAAAMAVLQRVLRHNPDLELAREAVAEIGRRRCRGN